MLVTIHSSRPIGGSITAPPSKSMAHRAVLCSALAKGTSHIGNLEFSKDVFRQMARDLYGRLKQFEDTGLMPEEVLSMSGEWCAMMSVLNSVGVGYDRLRELAAADKDGRVVVLPCNVGDTVYFVNAKQILEFAVVGYAVDETGISWVHSEHVDKIGNTNERTFSPDRFGKNTFPTREEAENALQKMEDKA